MSDEKVLDLVWLSFEEYVDLYFDEHEPTLGDAIHFVKTGRV